MNKSHLTIIEKILVAANEKWPNANDIFTEADITLAAWYKYPETFGLRGYAKEHPDSRRVLSNIMGTKGLRGKSWIKPLGDTRYRLTQSGRDYAITLMNINRSNTEDANNSLNSNEIRFLRRLIDSNAFERWENGQKENILLRDALSYWGLTATSNKDDFNDRMATLNHTCFKAVALLKTNKDLNVGARTKKIISYSEINEIHIINGFLQEKFDYELSFIKKRIQKRGINRVID